MKYDRKKIEAAITDATWTGGPGSVEQTRAMILAALDAIFGEPHFVGNDPRDSQIGFGDLASRK